MAAREYDVLIIGSGASGGMAAYVLAQAGVKCAMLDAGPLLDLNKQHIPMSPADLPYRGFRKPGKVPHVFQSTEFADNVFVDETEVPYTHDPKSPYNWVRIRMIGGKSLFWARMSFRLSDYEFKGKDHDGFGDNWPISYADLKPYYDRVEPIFQVQGRNEGLASLPDGVFIPDTSSDSECNRSFIAAGAKRGIRNTKIRRALGRGLYASSKNLLLPAASASGNLTLIPDAIVRDITIDKNTGRVNGANFIERHSRREMHVKAKCVVLGASCLESTRILLNSGIANSSGTLGHYLHDQFYITDSVQAVIPQARNGKAASGYIGGAGYTPRFRNLATKEKDFLRGYAWDWYTGASIDAKYFPLYGAELQRELDATRNAAFSCTTMGEVLARYENQVRLSKTVKDAWGIPVLDIQCRYSSNEINMARDSVQTLEELCKECGWEVLSKNPTSFPPGYSIHELGTCRMGDNPKTSVLNAWNQSHDIKNLFVVDGSSFVSGGSQNPTLTILALSMRASEHLLELRRRGDL